MNLFSVKYDYDNGVKSERRRAIICAEDENDAWKILTEYEEKIYDTFININDIERIYLDESKIISINKSRCKNGIY